MSALVSDRAVCGVGTSGGPDARAAAEQAVTRALERLDGRTPDLVLVYASVRYDLKTVVSTIRAATGDAALAGASTAGQLHCGDLTAPGDGVAVLALAGGGYRFGVAHVDDAFSDPDRAGSDLARAARAAAGRERAPHEAVVVFSDGIAGDQQGLLTGIHKITGFAVPVIGGAASDDRQLRETFVFAGDRVLTRAAVAVWVGSSRPLRVVDGHGWRPTSLPLMVSDVDGAVVRELGGRPAREVYEEHFQTDPPDLDTCRSDRYHPTHAFGVIQPDGKLVIRAAFVDEEGNLVTLSPMPPYAAVHVVSVVPDDLLAVGDETVSAAVDGADPAVVLVFDCVARLDILGERGPEEARRLQRAAGTAPVFGFYTYGEFARTTGVAGYHNASIAAMAL